MKAILLVLDSFGIGEAPDAAKFGDLGSNTYKAISEGINVPNLLNLGLNNIDGVTIEPKEVNPRAEYARLIEKSVAKDTTTGHFEMMGIITDKPYPAYPDGFPEEILNELKSIWNVGGILGNKAASGTVIINELGDEHNRTGYPIVYTSADSVMQIACDVNIFPLEKLYEMCIQARALMRGDNNVARVIARPFTKNDKNEYVRTPDRRDFGLRPPIDSMLDKLSNNNVKTIAVGKIRDIFSGCGIDEHLNVHSNESVINATIKAMKENDNCFIFSNLVEFDMLYGHRNDVAGYRKCLEDFDQRLPEILSAMENGDLLMITADHGCDPSTPSTDHSRECVPLIKYVKNGKKKGNLGTIFGFDYISWILSDYFKINK